MTEAEWLECTDHHELVTGRTLPQDVWVRRRFSGRVNRLLAIGMARLVSGFAG